MNVSITGEFTILLLMFVELGLFSSFASYKFRARKKRLMHKLRLRRDKPVTTWNELALIGMRWPMANKDWRAAASH
jgi:hypothetical protein